MAQVIGYIYYVLEKCLKVVGPQTHLTGHRCHHALNLFLFIHSATLNVSPHGDKMAAAVPSLTPLPTVSQVEMKGLGREKCMCMVRRQEDFLLTYVSYHGGNSFPEHPADFLFHWPGWGHMSTPRPITGRSE